ncbi:hypothetical protein [Psychrobacter fozii]|uniref:hypothetical protein n=1 Tax=Psychrobacter fozii TaxID=198480 RepID=UPI0024828F4A|nr:hypothetical protein [Psychrobacter fozii]
MTRPYDERIEAWKRLSTSLDMTQLDAITREIGLSEVIPTASELLDGKIRGRIVVDVNR